MWTGRVGIAQKTGFGRVSPLPGIWPSLHPDSAITLPVGVEAYAAYAPRAYAASLVAQVTVWRLAAVPNFLLASSRFGGLPCRPPHAHA